MLQRKWGPSERKEWKKKERKKKKVTPDKRPKIPKTPITTAAWGKKREGMKGEEREKTH